MEYKKLGGRSKEPYFGIELEIQCRSKGDEASIKEEAIAVFKCKEHLGFDQDGGGVEVQFPPCKYRYLIEHKQEFADFLATIPKHRGSTDRSTCAGMHVHVSKTGFKVEQAVSMFKFLKRYTNLTKFVAKRTRLHSYFSTNTINSFSTEEHIRTQYQKTYYEFYMGAIAIGRKGIPTIEFRMFNSTSDLTKFFANIEFVRSMYLVFGGSNEPKEITEMDYLNYVLENKQELPHLFTYLTKYKVDGSVKQNPLRPKVKTRKNTSIANGELVVAS